MIQPSFQQLSTLIFFWKAKEIKMSPVDWMLDGGVKRFFRARRKLNAPGIICHITQRAAGADGHGGRNNVRCCLPCLV